MTNWNSRATEEKIAKQIAVPLALIMPLGLALIAWALVYQSDAQFPVADFYSLAAQIIPILMIAFALESRATEFFSDPQIKFYRLQLFLFLLGGEIFALLGASGSLRGDVSMRQFSEGLVAKDDWANLIAAGTAAGLVGGFAMLAVLALSGPGWLFLSFRRDPRRLREEADRLDQKLHSAAPDTDRGS